ncbi:MAG: hypothetical protein ACKO5F_00345 [Synechococcus sp.]
MPPLPRLLRRSLRLHLSAVLLGAALLAPQALAQPAKPPPPASRPTIYEPDQATCRPEAIATAFQQHLAPFADQPESVQQTLRGIQAEMTNRSIEGCEAKSLLTPEEAAQLRRQLGLRP